MKVAVKLALLALVMQGVAHLCTAGAAGPREKIAQGKTQLARKPAGGDLTQKWPKPWVLASGLAGLAALASYTSGAAVPATSLGMDAEVVEAGEMDSTDTTQPHADLSGPKDDVVAIAMGALSGPAPDGIAHQWALSQPFYLMSVSALAGAALYTVLQWYIQDELSPHDSPPTSAQNNGGVQEKHAQQSSSESPALQNQEDISANISTQAYLRCASTLYDQAYVQYEHDWDVAMATWKQWVSAWQTARWERNNGCPAITAAIKAVNEAHKVVQGSDTEQNQSHIACARKQLAAALGGKNADDLVEAYSAARIAYKQADAKWDLVQKNYNEADKKPREYQRLLGAAKKEATESVNEAVAQLELAEAALYGKDITENEALRAARGVLENRRKERDGAYKKWEVIWEQLQVSQSTTAQAQFYDAKASFYKVQAQLDQGRANFYRALPDLYTELTELNKAQAKIYEVDAKFGQASAEYKQAQERFYSKRSAVPG